MVFLCTSNRAVRLICCLSEWNCVSDLDDCDGDEILSLGRNRQSSDVAECSTGQDFNAVSVIVFYCSCMIFLIDFSSALSRGMFVGSRWACEFRGSLNLISLLLLTRLRFVPTHICHRAGTHSLLLSDACPFPGAPRGFPAVSRSALLATIRPFGLTKPADNTMSGEHHKVS